jgi:SAM-dependent methyltransferase
MSAAAGYLQERPARANAGAVRPFGDALGDVAGLRVVAYGCGDGSLAVLLAERGGWVSTFGGSRASVQQTRRRAEAYGVRVEAVEARAERLPYADETFDLAVGQAVLGGLDAERAAAELRRILKPGGKAVFAEPARLELAGWREGFSDSGRRHLGPRLPFIGRQVLVWMIK